MKLNCLTISIISLIIFITILYLINKNQNQNNFKFVENYADLYDTTTERLEPLKTIILNARDNKNFLKAQTIDVKQLICDDKNKNSSGLCLKKYMINHPKIII